MSTDLQTANAKRKARLLLLIGSAALLLAVAVLGLTGWTVFKNWSDAQTAAQVVQSNRDILRTLNSLMINVGDAETGERGFMLTRRDRYLEPYRSSLGPVEANLKTLSKIADARPDRKAAIYHLQGLVRVKMDEMAETVRLLQSQGFDAAMAEMLTDKGLLRMEEIRTVFKAEVESQRAQVASDARESAAHQTTAIRFLAAGSAILLSLMLAGMIILNSSARQQMILAETLANSREVFETTLISIGDGLLATDLSGRITFINPEAAALTGWPRTEAVGKSLDEVFRIVKNNASELENPLAKVSPKRNAVGLANHTILVSKNGAEIPIDDSESPIRDAYGNVSGRVLVFRNITERRKAEDSLELSHGEVLKANEELRQFSYAATHDLQEPLRTIVVFSQLLGRSYKLVLDERGQHLLQTVEQAALRMSSLIDHLLAYTRVGGMDSSGTRQVVDPTASWEDALVQLKGAIEETKAVITHADLPPVWVETAQLSQLFQNLISNAIKYRKPEVTPAIHLTAVVSDRYATFQVADNGIGFKQEYSDRIFLLFQRLHGRSIPGTGIGLALCRRIVERHGGKIWVVSEEHKGSSFCFTLPTGPVEI